MDSTHSEPKMKRELGLVDSVMIVAGSMIGSGIFIVSAEMMREIGSTGYMLVLWLVTGVITMIGAISYGELAAMMPKAGGQYVYLREAYSPLVGFLYGWMVFLAIQTGFIAAVAIAFAKFSGVLFPWISDEVVLLNLGFRITSQDALAVFSVLILTYINLQGVKSAKWVQRIFTALKIVGLIALIAFGLWAGSRSGFWEQNIQNLWSAFRTTTDVGLTRVISVESLSGMALVGVLGCAIVGPLFSSDAWNSITYTAGEVKNPQRNIPLSLFLGTLIVTVLYILTNIAYLSLLPAHGSPEASDTLGRGIMFAAQDRVATSAMEILFGGAAVSMMAIMIMVSTFGCNNGLIMSGGRLFYAMARDGLLFKKIGLLNSKGVPAYALVFQGVWICLLCFTGTYSAIIAYAVFAQLIFYIMTVVGIFILRKRQPNRPRPYKAIGYPVLPLLYVILASGICLCLLIYKPFTSWMAVGLILTGIPIYFIAIRKKKSIKNRIGDDADQ